jgi:hypothetical protein
MHTSDFLISLHEALFETWRYEALREKSLTNQKLRWELLWTKSFIEMSLE